ncbi:hypothetical protein ACFV1U_38615 [Streptomyces microflavus]|uniref:hypothetical protein n=1 Tax=Streptomyces microflavus TaxID=1919 RepID=UPI0036877810
MSFLPLTTVRDLDGEPTATVTAQFYTGTYLPHTWMIIATTGDDGGHPDGVTIHLGSYGPFADLDGARAWAEAHLAPYGTRYTAVPLTTPYTYADVEKDQGKPGPAKEPRPARAHTIARYLKPYTLTRLRHDTRTDTPRHGYTAREMEHPELGPVVELTALGPDPYQRDRDHRLMQTVLHQDHPRYQVTDERTCLLVRRLSDTELHAAADRAADRVAPHLAALTNAPAPQQTGAETAPAFQPTAAAETAHTLFNAVLSAAREVASDDPDDADLMDQVRDMDGPDALAALTDASLPSDMIGPIADALTHLAPHAYATREQALEGLPADWQRAARHVTD